jgi:hypothetical protein
MLMLCSLHIHGQVSAKTDSVIRSILGSESLTGAPEGKEMILSGNVTAAGSYFNEALQQDEGNKDAYFGRGIVNWVMNDTLNACRDWSAVLALGDTETFRLLDSKCHGTMIVEDDVLTKDKYHRMFADAGKTKSTMQAKTVVEQMPEFPGGEKALIQYLSKAKKTKQAEARHVSGTVYINFVVNSKGKVLYPYVVRGIGYGCDEVALNLIRNMPLWKPGREKGRPVLVRHTLPVKF